MCAMEAKIRVENLVMIFGRYPRGQALRLFQQGASKDEVLKETGHVVGVADASFTVQQGEIFVVMGLSGSGKSTLIRCLNRINEPTSGRIYVDGDDIVQFSPARLRELRRTRMAMVFQHFALLPHRTVAENAAYGLKIRGVNESEQREKALTALEMVGLHQWADRYPHNLSGGMKQRVGLARALATDADILLMDEAFSALDPLIRRQMQTEMLKLQETLHKTIVFITHDLSEALRVGNHIAVMRDGKIVQIGTPVQIVTEPADEYVAAFTQDVDHGRVLTAELVMKPADVLMLGRDAVETAVNRLNDMDANACYVVNKENKLEGVLVKDKFIEALQNGSRHNKDLRHYIERDFPTTSHDSSLAELYALCANGLPVAVLDNAGRIKGVVHPLDVLASLAEGEKTEEELVESP